MPPFLAAFICILFILYLLWTDSKHGNEHSTALWIPFLWMFFAGSRAASAWLNLRPPLSSASAIADGSPLDRAVFLLLIVAGALVLSRRKIDWKQLLAQNKWIVLYYLYCLSSITWADDPFVLFKRWIKELGNPIMALVLLTERRPYEATGITLRRIGFVLLPLSILFIRYFPELGRDYHNDGTPMYTGVGNQKNDLGQLCLVTGLYFSWKLLRLREESFKARDMAVRDILIIALLVYLLYLSNSQTSLSCLVVGVGLFLVGRMAFIAKKPSRIVPFLVFATLVVCVLEATLDLKALVFELLGRDPTLTNRTDLWELLLGLGTNPYIGTGFMSFWSGERLEFIWTATSHGLNQAHSGYLEQYLNLGYIGLACIGLIAVSGLLKVRRQLDSDPAPAMLRLSFIVTAVFYNYTEAAMFGINNMWFLLLLACIDISGQQAGKPVSQVRASIRQTGLGSPRFK